MTKSELIEILLNLNSNDEEKNHIEADKALLKYINDPRIEEAYNKIKKWYA